ncbi:unnamed protein product [Brassicogethes aeneus]|uniref:Peptidoglycan-recognition protein n=1 Tax=Brassicogethes aeneus TaxID=1431903 RepID=A0A9P0FE55_BRAAE|nr:unnamed protein product [Brassicogethes aeneus]
MYSLLLFVILADFLREVCAISDVDIVPRDAWGARPPYMIEAMANPVPYVVIHHSYIPPACNTTEDCMQAMRSMQDYHQLNHSWNDIGYSFAVGGDGRAYMGRGWDRVGAHAPKFNDKSIGICIIGDWSADLPPERQLKVTQDLIEMGVRDGAIQKDYILLGHKQTKKKGATECPGDRLFEEIQTWPNWQNEALPDGKKETFD